MQSMNSLFTWNWSQSLESSYYTFCPGTGIQHRFCHFWRSQAITLRRYQPERPSPGSHRSQQKYHSLGIWCHRSVSYWYFTNSVTTASRKNTIPSNGFISKCQAKDHITDSWGGSNARSSSNQLLLSGIPTKSIEWQAFKIGPWRDGSGWSATSVLMPTYHLFPGKIFLAWWSVPVRWRNWLANFPTSRPGWQE